MTFLLMILLKSRFLLLTFLLVKHYDFILNFVLLFWSIVIQQEINLDMDDLFESTLFQKSSFTLVALRVLL